MIYYKCILPFKSYVGRLYGRGDEITTGEYGTLLPNERQNFLRCEREEATTNDDGGTFAVNALNLAASMQDTPVSSMSDHASHTEFDGGSFGGGGAGGSFDSDSSSSSSFDSGGDSGGGDCGGGGD